MHTPFSNPTGPAGPILFESHAHTPLCQHAIGTPEEYAAAAEMRGLKGIIFTCHTPLPNGLSSHVRMRPDQVGEYVRMVDRAREAFAGRVDVRLGLESDFMPGLEPWLEKLHARLPLNHVLGSIHPQIGEYRALYFRNDPWLYQEVYFEHLAQAAESGLYDSLAHPDLIKNEAPHAWDPARVLPHVRRALDRIAKTGVAMELNTSGLNKALPEMNPAPWILEEVHARGIPVVIGSDAHLPERVGDRFVEALDLLGGIGFAEVTYFLERRPHRVAIAAARASLAREEPAARRRAV